MKKNKKAVMREARKEGESFMEESKEIGFDAPGVKPPKRRFDLGGLMDKDKPKEKQPTAPKPPDLGNSKGLPLPAAPNVPPSKREEKIGTALQGVGQGIVKKRGGLVETGMDVVARGNRAEGEATMAGKKKMGGKKIYKTGGAKTMEPGGGGRFAAMVGKLKGQGKSEESAEAIAASAGRKKYGKSRFQSMAAAGKKKMGGKKC